MSVSEDRIDERFPAADGRRGSVGGSVHVDPKDATEQVLGCVLFVPAAVRRVPLVRVFDPVAGRDVKVSVGVEREVVCVICGLGSGKSMIVVSAPATFARYSRPVRTLRERTYDCSSDAFPEPRGAIADDQAFVVRNAGWSSIPNSPISYLSMSRPRKSSPGSSRNPSDPWRSTRPDCVAIYRKSDARENATHTGMFSRRPPVLNRPSGVGGSSNDSLNPSLPLRESLTRWSRLLARFWARCSRRGLRPLR